MNLNCDYKGPFYSIFFILSDDLLNPAPVKHIALVATAATGVP